jgi:signal peptidase
VFAGIALFVLAGMSGGDRRETTRHRDRQNVVAVWVVVVFAVVVVTAFATAAMVLPAGVHEFGVISSQQPTAENQVVRPGGAANVTYEVHNGGFLPVLVMHDPASNGVAVEPDRAVVGGGEREPVNVTMQAPSETGQYLRSVRESRYLLVLPAEVLAWLHSLHPLFALAVVDAIVAAFVFALAIAVFGTGQLRLRPSGGSVPLGIRLRRRVRRWW